MNKLQFHFYLLNYDRNKIAIVNFKKKQSEFFKKTKIRKITCGTPPIKTSEFVFGLPKVKLC